MSENERPLRVGVVGHRSFIAKALTRRLTEMRIEAIPLMKERLRTYYLLGLDCVYLFLGRDRPSAEEAADELEQVRAYVGNYSRCKRTVYLSSRSAMPHKREAEDLIRSIDGRIVSPPAVFGPEQRPDSGMLIPSLVRSNGELELREPGGHSSFVHADALARHLADLTDESTYREYVDRGVPGTFVLTPAQVRDLYLTFRSLIDSADQ